MTSGRALALLLSAVLIGLIGLVVMSGDDAASLSKPASESVRPDGVDRDTGQHAISNAGVGALPPEGSGKDDALPALETPLALSVDELQRRATAGDAAAACRLAAELDQCAQAARQGERYAGFLGARLSRPASSEEPSRLSEPDDDWEEVASGWAEEVDRLARHCHGVAVISPGESARLWHRAASSGSISAQRAYASGSVFRLDDVLDSLDELKTYRSQAQPMALALAQRGDIPMALVLAYAHLPESVGHRHALLSQVVGEDPPRAWALYEWAKSGLTRSRTEHSVRELELIELRLQDLAVQMTDQQLLRAQEILEQELVNWQPPDPGSHRSPVATGYIGGDRRVDCEGRS